LDGKGNPVHRRTVLRALGTTLGAVALESCGVPQAPPSDARGDAVSGCGELAGATIRWIVPNAPGGGFDAEARLIEPFVERRLGVEVAVDNVPGAAGIVGARTIKDARPDGRTVGILGVPGLLAAALTSATEAPNPARDFAVLGRVSRSWHVWAVGARVGTADELVARSARRPLTFAISEVSSASFVSVTVSSDLLGATVEIVPGYSGTRDATLAAIRGDVDCVCFNFDTIVDLVEAGDLKPVLQLADSRVAAHPSLDDVPLLGGDQGLAVRRARAAGTSTDAARETASVLTQVVSAGRVVVAPLGIRDELLRCLETRLFEALSDPELHAAARHELDVAPASVAGATIQEAASKSDILVPLIRQAIGRVRS
jgi:tripartite-type tricarboxylate transporter receptor subunit TctC